MNRQECEQLILEKILEIKEIYEKYKPDFKILSIAVTDSIVWANNEYWGADKDKQINVTKFIEEGDNPYQE